MRIRPAAAHLFVGAYAHIGPTECTIFTKIFGEFAASQRADVGIGPYTEMGRCIRVCRSFSQKTLHSAGGQSRPPLQRRFCAALKGGSHEKITQNPAGTCSFGRRRGRDRDIKSAHSQNAGGGGGSCFGRSLTSRRTPSSPAPEIIRRMRIHCSGLSYRIRT